MKPLLAHIYEPKRVTFPCYVQPKLNGIRALYQNGRFQSRDETPFPSRLLDHLAKPLQAIFEPSVILDGELYCHGWPLQRINAAVTPVRQEPTEDTLKVEYHIFDRVDYKQSFAERISIPQKIPIATQDFPSFFVFTRLVHSQEQADFHYNDFVSHGFEGAMYRLGDCPYTIPKQKWGTPGDMKVTGQKLPRSGYLSDQDNRVWHLLKRKDWQDDEFLCVGMQEGEGKYKDTLGALRCNIHIGAGERRYIGGNPTFTVSSGLTDAERAHYWTNPPIGRLVKVRYLVLSSDGIPLNPSILAIL